MHKIIRSAVFPIAILVAGLTLGASSATKPKVSGILYRVTMTNMQFGGLPSAAKVGDRILWINNDSVEHSATARDGSFDYRLKPGQKAGTVLRKPGVLRIDCIYHPTMRGVIKVSG